jgi:hypothetical protein
MNIPLDRFYNYIKDLFEELRGDRVLIYRFLPHGSKKIEDLKLLDANATSYYDSCCSPEIFCYDQEPLNYDLYRDCGYHQLVNNKIHELCDQKNIFFKKYNLRGEVRTIWDQAILLHSEKRSPEVAKYENTQFVPVYFWSHAVIARDWFRYAQHVTQKKHTKKTFLIYNRAWAGTREYRLKFIELLVQNNLTDICQTTFSPVDSESSTHYSQHQFDRPVWKPSIDLENFFDRNQTPSHFSADFDIKDYQFTDIEVVLETLFDDSRLHLTEKSLRPIACGQPFILAATHGSLEYLKSYGFKTFDSIWDESYDKITDPQDRMLSIMDTLKSIAAWDPETRQKYLQQAQDICNYNKLRFFSQEFFDQIIEELKTNFLKAWQHLESTNTASQYMDRRTRMRADPEIYNILFTMRSQEDYDQVWKTLEKYYLRGLQQISDNQ